MNNIIDILQRDFRSILSDAYLAELGEVDKLRFCMSLSPPSSQNLPYLFQVNTIEWDGPHTPLSHWHTLLMAKEPIPDQELITSLIKTIQNKKYFGICQHCNELNNVGHMHSDTMCQSCAERIDHVTY